MLNFELLKTEGLARRGRLVLKQARGSSGRGLVLTATYASIILFAGLPILPIAMLGLAETAFNIRDRFAKKRAPPSLPQNRFRSDNLPKNANRSIRARVVFSHTSAHEVS